MMNAATAQLARNLLMRHEGCKKTVYRDSLGIATIGIGRNIDTRGLSDDEIDYLFANDMQLAEGICLYCVGPDIWSALSTNRQAALLDMAFNLGLPRLLGFHDTLRAIKEARYNDAADAMLASHWATQVGERAARDADLMRNG